MLKLSLRHAHMPVRPFCADSWLNHPHYLLLASFQKLTHKCPTDREKSVISRNGGHTQPEDKLIHVKERNGPSNASQDQTHQHNTLLLCL